MSDLHLYQPGKGAPASRDLGCPKYFKDNNGDARVLYEDLLTAVGEDTHNVVVAYDRRDGTFQTFPETRRQISSLRKQGKRKVCFILPKNCDVSRIQILGELENGQKWLSGPIMAPCKAPTAQDTPSVPATPMIYKSNGATYWLPKPLDPKGDPSKKDCCGTCCMWKFGYCNRNQPAWRRSCILLFDLIMLAVHLFILYQILFLGTCCCYCCQEERIVTTVPEATIAASIHSSVKRAYTSFVHENKPKNPKGFDGLMTVVRALEEEP